METEIESINIKLSSTLKESSRNLPPSPKLMYTCLKLQKKIRELEIEIDDERKSRNQMALEISKAKKQKRN